MPTTHRTERRRQLQQPRLSKSGVWNSLILSKQAQALPCLSRMRTPNIDRDQLAGPPEPCQNAALAADATRGSCRCCNASSAPLASACKASKSISAALTCGSAGAGGCGNASKHKAQAMATTRNRTCIGKPPGLPLPHNHPTSAPIETAPMRAPDWETTRSPHFNLG
jgi:hypothetical protein